MPGRSPDVPGAVPKKLSVHRWAWLPTWLVWAIYDQISVFFRWISPWIRLKSVRLIFVEPTVTFDLNSVFRAFKVISTWGLGSLGTANVLRRPNETICETLLLCWWSGFDEKLLCRTMCWINAHEEERLFLRISMHHIPLNPLRKGLHCLSKRQNFLRAPRGICHKKPPATEQLRPRGVSCFNFSNSSDFASSQGSHPPNFNSEVNPRSPSLVMDSTSRHKFGYD